ncbi:MAG: hypothetical protein KC708_21745 [Anaerolineae bacterium]|nr:hypothetical protein [Anaerolineae bacterium]
MNDTLLRKALRANAAFCLGSGLLLTLASSSIAQWIGMSQSQIFGLVDGTTFIQVIGIILLPYGVLVGFLSMRQDLRLPGQFVTAMDMLWVVGSYGLLLSQILPLNTAGNWAVLIIADIVLAFALVQLWGLRIMNRTV